MGLKVFDQNITLINKAMGFRSRRNEMIASNIANRETPGYRAQDVVFEKALHTALHADEPGPLNTSDPRHFDGVERTPLELVEATRINSFNPDPKADGNTVNMDKEMAKLAENQVMYNALVKMANWKFNLLKDSITEGGR